MRNYLLYARLFDLTSAIYQQFVFINSICSVEKLELFSRTDTVQKARKSSRDRNSIIYTGKKIEMLKLEVLLIICALIFAFDFQLVKSLSEVYENARLEKLREVAIQLKETVQKRPETCTSSYNYNCKNEIVYFHQSSPAFVDYDYFRQLNENDPKISKSEIYLKKFILSCENRNKNYVAQLRDLELAKIIGGWPFFNENWNANKFDLAEVFGKVNRYNIRTNFILYPMPMSHNLYIYFNPEFEYKVSEIRDQFVKYNITTELFDLQDVAVEIVEINKKVIQLFKNSDTYEHYTLIELKEKAPEFNWDKLFETYFDIPIETIPSSFKITFNSLETFKTYIHFLQSYDKKNLANYVMWKMMISESMPWESDCTNEIEYELYVFNPITSKASIQKAYNKFNEEMYLSALEEVKILLGNLNGRSLIKSSSYQSAMTKVTTDIEFISKYSDAVISNDLIDSHFSNMEMSWNYLQNYYKYEGINRDFKINHNKTKEISDLFYYFREKSDIIEYCSPSFVVFSNFVSTFWNQFVVDDLNETGVLTRAIECIQARFPGIDSNEAKNRIFYNEALRLTVKTYENWLETNLEIKQKENAVLAQFNLTHRDLLLSYKTQGDCKDITKLVTTCPRDEEGKLTCAVYDI